MSSRLISHEAALDAYCSNSNDDIKDIKKLMKNMKKVKRDKNIKIKWRTDIPKFIPKDELTLFNK